MSALVTARRNARARQRRDDAPGAGFLGRCLGGAAHEHAPAARGITRGTAIDRAGDGDGVERHLPAGVPVHVEVRQRRLPLRLVEREGASREGDADVVRPGRHADAHVQVLVHGLVGVVDAHLIPVGLHREHLHARAVERQLDLLGLCQPLHVLVAIARQTYLNLVDAGEWKRVASHRPATRSEWQALQVIFLRQVRREDEQVVDW